MPGAKERPDGTEEMPPGAAATGDAPGVPGEFAPSWPPVDFFGRPRPGPGRRVMGFIVGSRLLELELGMEEAPFETEAEARVGAGPEPESDLACALLSP